MLARAACDAQRGAVPRLRRSTRDQWEAVHIASWLHDCGKVTTPEYVVDKATKLETIYDRIHEVRMRFEVLKRDAEIAYWKGVAEGGDRGSAARGTRRRTRRARRRVRLRRALQRRRRVPGRRDSRAAAARSPRAPGRARSTTASACRRRRERAWTGTAAAPLPVGRAAARRQARARHRARSRRRRCRADNPWGFRLEVPELHSTTAASSTTSPIGRGTLTAEERYKINDHIVQTIIMLVAAAVPAASASGARRSPAATTRRWTAPAIRAASRASR